MTERGLSRLEMILAVLVVVLLVSTTASAYLFYAERDKPKDVEAGEGIAQVAFVREGVVVELDQMEDAEANDRLGDIVDLGLEDHHVDLVHPFGRKHSLSRLRTRP